MQIAFEKHPKPASIGDSHKIDWVSVEKLTTEQAVRVKKKILEYFPKNMVAIRDYMQPHYMEEHREVWFISTSDGDDAMFLFYVAAGKFNP